MALERLAALTGHGQLNALAVLEQTDAHLTAASREASAAQEEVDRLAAQREALRAEEAEALQALARLRVAELTDGAALIGALDSTSARLAETLLGKAADKDAARQAVAAAREALKAAEAKRNGEAAALRSAEAEEAQALAASAAKAAEDDEQKRLEAAAEAAGRVAQHAAQKAEFARRDLEEKGRPYRDDPLFAYLWDRGFGTSRYEASAPVRFVDGWVARLSGYDAARRSFALLSDLPGHLAGHAERMARAAEESAAAAHAHRRRLAGLAETPEQAAAALDAAEEAVLAAQSALHDAEATLTALAAGDDEASREAVRALERALGQKPLQALREEAARTPTREDDAIVARLEVAAAERAGIERALTASRAQAETARRRLAELQAVQRDLRDRARMGGPWGAGGPSRQPRGGGMGGSMGGAMLGVLLGEMLRGGLSRDGFWDKVDRQRGPGRWHDTWSGGSGGGMGGGAPWGGGRSGGGRQDGGMSGGGFKTGGQF